MILTFDIETQGLNAQKFILGCIVTDTGIQETFYKKERLWKRILEIGRKEEQRGHNLVCYAHNLQYDLYGVIDWSLPGIQIYSKSPLIVDYRNIKFIDSTALYRGKLEDLGNLIGEKKSPTPEWLKLSTYEPSDIELWDAARYCMQDCVVLLKGIQMLRKQLQSEGISIRTMITIGQCAMNGYIRYLQRREEGAIYFRQGKDENGQSYASKGVFPETTHREKIHGAYKGARTQAFKRGDFIANMADVNSMYPYIMTIMDYPDLRTEQLHENVSLANYDYQRLVKNRICILKAHIRTGEDDNIGSLPIRTEEEQQFPTNDKDLVGTWTSDEIQEAVRRGAYIKHIFWMITWEKMRHNPLKEYIETLYEKKRKSTNDYERWFYKQLMNQLYGKFAQHRTNTTYETGSIDETEERLNNGWEILLALNATTNLYYKKSTTVETKKFYAPIISALITSGARIQLNRMLEKIGRERLLYCDTDGFIWEGDADEFKYSDRLGELKLVHANTLTTILNKKTYRIGEEYHASGIPKNALNDAAFTGTPVNYPRIISPFDTDDASAIGTFIDVTKNIALEDITESDEQLFIDNNEINEETLSYLSTAQEDYHGKRNI